MRSPRLVGTATFLAVGGFMLTLAAVFYADARRSSTEAVAAPIVASRIVPAAGRTSTAHELVYKSPGPEGPADQAETVPVALWEAAVQSGQVRLKRDSDGRAHIWQPASTTTLTIVAGIGAAFALFSLVIALPASSSWFERRIAQLPFWVLFGSIWMSVGLPFLGSSLFLAWQDWRLSTASRTTEGVVLFKEVTRSGKNGSTPTYRHSVRYRFQSEDGRTREGESEVSEAVWSGTAEGRPVPIEYLPGSSTHRVAGAHRRWTLAIFGAVGLLVGGAGALIVRADWRHRNRVKRLQETGVRTPARVLAVEAARIRVGGEPLWKITYEYRDREQRKRKGTTQVTAEEAEQWKAGDAATILLDPVSPASTVWIGA
jgi:hypothetical protein